MFARTELFSPFPEKYDADLSRNAQIIRIQGLHVDFNFLDRQ